MTAGKVVADDLTRPTARAQLPLRKAAEMRGWHLLLFSSPLSTYRRGVVGKGESSFTRPQGIIEDGWNKPWVMFRLKTAGVLFSLPSPSEWRGGHKTKAISL